jgi:CATRA-associated small protein
MNSVSVMTRPAGWDADTVADALDVLAEVPSWELSPQRWDQVGVILDRMDAAFAGHHAQDLRDAVADLALNGPTRIERIGSNVRTGEPDQVVTRRIPLVHALSKEQPDPKDARGAERHP